MTAEQFKQLLERLTHNQLQSILDGEALCLLEDEALDFADRSHPNRLELAIETEIQSAEALGQFLATEAPQLYQAYYRNHVLTTRGFSRQLQQLIDIHGEAALVSMPGKPADVSLFVEAGELLALDDSDPRYPYGATLELSHSVDQAAAANQVRLWIDSNDAYQQYLSMNVCRYNC